MKRWIHIQLKLFTDVLSFLNSQKSTKIYWKQDYNMKASVKPFKEESSCTNLISQVKKKKQSKLSPNFCEFPVPQQGKN